MKKPPFLIILVITFVILVVGNSLNDTDDVDASTLLAGNWTWPLDGNFIVLTNGKYGTTVENTDYGVKNLDLVHPSFNHITCFKVGWHRLYHAGVDLYLRDGNTAGVPVKAVSNGVVKYVDSGFENVSVIIQHPKAGVYSVYWHLENPQVSNGQKVTKGQVIGYVYSQTYSGRFPDVHPFGSDDSHLHFPLCQDRVRHFPLSI